MQDGAKGLYTVVGGSLCSLLSHPSAIRRSILSSTSLMYFCGDIELDIQWNPSFCSKKMDKEFWSYDVQMLGEDLSSLVKKYEGRFMRARISFMLGDRYADPESGIAPVVDCQMNHDLPNFFIFSLLKVLKQRLDYYHTKQHPLWCLRKKMPCSPPAHNTQIHEDYVRVCDIVGEFEKVVQNIKQANQDILNLNSDPQAAKIMSCFCTLHLNYKRFGDLCSSAFSRLMNSEYMYQSYCK